jgi:hypothetical protein
VTLVLKGGNTGQECRIHRSWSLTAHLCKSMLHRRGALHSRLSWTFPPYLRVLHSPYILPESFEEDLGQQRPSMSCLLQLSCFLCSLTPGAMPLLPHRLLQHPSQSLGGIQQPLGLGPLTGPVTKTKTMAQKQLSPSAGWGHVSEAHGLPQLGKKPGQNRGSVTRGQSWGQDTMPTKPTT